MKLSFSTRGWASQSWDGMVEEAAEMRFSGIEPYNPMRCTALTEKGGAFHKYSVMATWRGLREKGLSIPCLDSSCDLSSADSAVREELSAMIALAADLRCPCICAYASAYEAETIKANIAALLPPAAQAGVTLLVKTSGAFSDTALLRDLMNGFASDNLAVLWDVHHPYRDKGESPAQSISNLGAYVKHVHLRDSEEDGSYTLIGEGTFPVQEVIDALWSIDYDAFISLEWKPQWMPDFTQRDVILPFFVNYMERFERDRIHKELLYPNHDGSG